MKSSPGFWRDATLRAHFLVNVGVGILIALVFALTANSRWGEGITNTAFDLLVRYEHQRLSAAPSGESPLFFVEITPDEYRRWGEPLLTPRDRVADLIESAWRKEAPVVVLDILLDRPDHGNPAGDARLRRLLERMLRENARTQVIFPVRIGADGDLRPHICDDLLDRRSADGRQILHRAVPTVVASEGDLLNRFWGLYEAGRDSGGKLRIVWSVPVLAAALHHDARSLSTEASAALERAAAGLLAGVGHGAQGAQAGSGAHGAERQLRLGGAAIDLPPLLETTPPGGRHPVYQAGESHNMPYTQRVRFLIPAGTKERRDAGNFRPGLSPDTLAGRIVVIGNGSPETGDILPTPVGRMPGMYLLGDAINTIVAGQMPVHLPGWLHLAAEGVIIVFAAWLFLRFHSLLAQIIASTVFIVLLVPLSWFIFQQWGLFFNFLVPVIGMRLHKTADGIEEMIASRGKKLHHHHH